MVFIKMSNDALTYQFINNTTFVMGNRKNAGKTTFMNWALNQIRHVESPALATIGIDGESNDMIDGREKPLIHTVKGDAVVTSANMLKRSNGLFKVTKALPIKTPLGQLVIAQTIRDGYIELVGPEHNQQLEQVVSFLSDELGYKSIIIDGAASRITPIASIRKSSLYYLVNIDRKNLTKMVEQMQLISIYSKFIKAKDTEKPYVINGALTPSKLTDIPDNCSSILINDMSAIFLNYRQAQQLLKYLIIRVKNEISLKAFVVVLKDIKQEEFSKQLIKAGINTKIIYNPYVH
ncbi:hypothetical protein [Carboxylicivirga marina]|uniref:Uncharacterized protein n=1 Tax=Carboxylicivirga marina TaxID=2800988 RepID=A0ABS1HFS2_9BACT|nr:hypothetical protein [Carboxylicivirga marina]MBK3516498.1 hypothetical protein [Carboxylicivirga marina]